MKDFDFTLRKYRKFCEALIRYDCYVMTVRDFIEKGMTADKVVVLRHDVDRFLSSAMRMAQLEYEYGIRASYYIRKTHLLFKPSKMKLLTRWGHEVGYHYEVLSRRRGEFDSAVFLFKEELEAFRRHVPLHTVSMHGSPLTPWNNSDIWKHSDYRDFGLIGELSSSIDYRNTYYFTDTGRSWNSDIYNIRDRFDAKVPSREIRTTNELIGFLKIDTGLPVLINTHPNRWSDLPVVYGFNWIFDMTANWVKLFLKKKRERKGIIK